MDPAFKLTENEMISSKRWKIDELVVNWHLTEACNFGCQFCYAQWKKADKREVWRDEAKTLRLLSDISSFFDPANPRTPLSDYLEWSRVRLSIAGGEPTLLGDLLVRIAQQAKSLGLDVSLITNGSRLETVEKVLPYLALLGISLDSAKPDTNATIGRLDRRGNQVCLTQIHELLSTARTQANGPKIKINTVVNSANHTEDFSPLLYALQPDRWKVLRMLPVTNSALEIGSHEFDAFVRRHHVFKGIMSVEDNHVMEKSYLMIDPNGRFFQNGTGQKEYKYSNPILEVGLRNALSQIAFCPERFALRYRPVFPGEVA